MRERPHAEARADCISRGGELLTEQTGQEFDAARNEQRKISVPGVHIGLQSNGTPSTNRSDYTWLSTGLVPQPVSWNCLCPSCTCGGCTCPDDNWGSIEPNNAGGIEGVCVEHRAYDNDWNDIACDFPRMYMCQIGKGEGYQVRCFLGICLFLSLSLNLHSMRLLWFLAVCRLQLFKVAPKSPQWQLACRV